MKWVLLWFLGTTGVLVVATCLAVLFVRHRIQRRHRVHPGAASPAPVRWMVDPRQPAQLHRRLAHVGRATTAVAEDHRAPRKVLRRSPEQPPLVAVAEALRDQAARLDHQVARVALLDGAARRKPLADLTSAVTEVEQASAKLVALSAEIRTPPMLATDDADILDAAAQVARLAEAHRALLVLDEAAGLVPDETPGLP